MTAQHSLSGPYQSEELDIFRHSVRRFFQEECAPHQPAWEEAGIAPRQIWLRAGELGFLCPRVPAADGGLGVDLAFSIATLEEQMRAGVFAPSVSVHSDVIAPYLVHYGTPEQKKRYLPGMIAGTCIGAIAMTEPSGGSDLKALRTTARRDGDSYVINGQKTFITNGIAADLVILAARTDAGARGIGLFLVETKSEGFRRGRNLQKLGQHASDTAELFFDDLRVHASALLGGIEGRGFAQLMDRLVEERLMAGVAAAAVIDRALELTVAYVKERKAFGKRVIDFQNTRFKLAAAKAEAAVLRAFLSRCIADFRAGTLDPATAAMLKYWATERQCSIVDDCVQLHGGYGYMLEYPIARMWLDSRITTIYGGANEVMKDIIGRSLR